MSLDGHNCWVERTSRICEAWRGGEWMRAEDWSFNAETLGPSADKR